MKVSVFMLILLSILTGFFNILYKISFIKSLEDGVRNLVTSMIKQYAGSGYLGSTEDVLSMVSEVNSSKEISSFLAGITAFFPSNGEVFIKGFLGFICICLITFVSIYIINIVLLHNKVKLNDIFVSCSFAYIPLVGSMLLSAILIRLNFIFSIVVILVGFILSIVKLYIVFRDVADLNEKTCYYSMYILLFGMALVIVCILSLTMGNVTADILKTLKNLPNFY